MSTRRFADFNNTAPFWSLEDKPTTVKFLNKHSAWLVEEKHFFFVSFIGPDTFVRNFVLGKREVPSSNLGGGKLFVGSRPPHSS